MVNVFFLNPNTTARVELQFWSSSSYGDSSIKHEIADRMTSLQKVVSCTTLADIEMYVEPRNLALDKLTLAILGSTAEMHFDQITMVWYYRSLTPVKFSIGGEYLQITGLKQQEWLPNVSVHLNDVFHLSDIDDVRSISIRGDDNTFFLSCRNGAMNFVFNSVNARRWCRRCDRPRRECPSSEPTTLWIVCFGPTMYRARCSTWPCSTSPATIRRCGSAPTTCCVR